jgi:CubicO group peptidase (beta-lactamase class C family)
MNSACRFAVLALALLALLALPPAFLAHRAAAEPAELPADLVARIDRFVEAERAASRIPGIALALVHDGRIVHVRGYGSAGGGRAVNGDTPFPIGSLTKSMTTVLARQLADEGRLDIDAPLQRYLPWFTLADAAAAQRITVRQLVNQTSGLSRADGLLPLLHGNDPGAEALARGLAGTPLGAPPGARYEYSNLNFALLGLVVEAVAQQPWQDRLRQRLFEPLDMAHSHAGMTDALADGMSEVHRYWFGFPVVQHIAFPRSLAAAGGTAASAKDMARYLLMMLRQGQGPRGAVLSEAAVRSMLSPGSPPGRSTLLGTTFDFRYGEGWFVGPFGTADDARWHLGSLASFASWMVLLPRTNQGVVVLINANSELPLFNAGAAFSRIPIGVVGLLRGQAPPSGATVAGAYAQLTAALAAIQLAVLGLAWWTVRRARRWLALVLALAAVAIGLALSFSAFGWRGFAQFVPDLVAWLATVLGVMLIPAALLARR